MRKAVLAAAAAFLLGGCLTTSSVREIRTTPPGATVTIPGFGECSTPCTVQFSQPRQVTIAKAGYKKQIITVGPRGGRILVPLELVAPSVDVDATSLPDLD